ncbi:MAG: hypothetical protein N3B13_03290, partial [Deltaproteobacteria bacterium]|nr:hypothetical protein [Deltaproteobacteria bacterium]
MRNNNSYLIPFLMMGLFFSCSDSDRDIGRDLYDFVLLDVKDSQDVRDTADYNYLDIFADDVLGDYFSDLDASESADTKDVEYEDISEREIIRPR